MTSDLLWSRFRDLLQECPEAEAALRGLETMPPDAAREPLVSAVRLPGVRLCVRTVARPGQSDDA